MKHRQGKGRVMDAKRKDHHHHHHYHVTALVVVDNDVSQLARSAGQILIDDNPPQPAMRAHFGIFWGSTHSAYADEVVVGGMQQQQPAASSHPGCSFMA